MIYLKKNFIAQTGDPTGTGRSGESIFRLSSNYYSKELNLIDQFNFKNKF